MATRANISVKSGNVYKTVYCHYDGYLKGVGAILLNHYNSQEAAEALIKEGNISSLGKKCDCPEGHSFDNPIPDYTVYYGRDRGDEDTGYKISEQKPKLKEEYLYLKEEYLYIFEDGKWFVSSEFFRDEELTEELIQKVTALIKGVVKMQPITKENMKSILKSRLAFIANFSLYITVNDLNLFLEHFPQIKYPEGVPFTEFENLFKAYGRTDIIKLIRIMQGHSR